MTWITVSDSSATWTAETDTSPTWATQADQSQTFATQYQYGYVLVGYVDPYYIDGEINPDPPPEEATNTWTLLSDQGTTWL